jgi:hypothetical protein
VLRAYFKTRQTPLTLRTPTGQLRLPISRLELAMAIPVASEAVLKLALSEDAPSGSPDEISDQ